MKSLLTIRSSLLAVNLIVIGLILWLTVSFLHIAVTQQSEAQQLEVSVDTERMLFLASNALALERESFDLILSAPKSPSARQLENLETTSLKSDESLDAVIIKVMHQIKELGLFKDSPVELAILKKDLDNIKKHRSQLSVYRIYLTSQSLLLPSERDQDMPPILFDKQTDLIESLVKLSKSLKYLPDSNSSAISNYNALFNEVLGIDIELARKTTALNKVLSGNTIGGLSSHIDDLVLGKKIEQRFTNIIQLAQASDNAEQLVPIAKAAQKFYKVDYVQAAFKIRSGGKKPSTAHWHQVKTSLSSKIQSLAEVSHVSVEELATSHGSRAKRNLFIDMFLFVACLVITFVSIVFNLKIKQYAYHDSLTKLPNRMSFESTLQGISDSKSQMHAVAFIDLDRFKPINDNYGHAIGDELLVEVARRLEATCESSHHLARMGGDEFAVFMPNVESTTAVEELASRIVAAVKNTVLIRGLSLKVGASVGISISPQDGENGMELLKNADIAMYYNKTNKLNNIYRFNQRMAGDYQERLQLELDLKKGLDNEEFNLLYQPKICTVTGQVKSVEALLRWSTPERGFVSPTQFIPVAEDTGQMGSIGQWALNEACREIALLRSSELPNIRVAVNISAQQFCDEQFVDSVTWALSSHDLSQDALELEVTESLVMNDVSRVISMLKTLKESGVTIAIDDFGTGYSSLQYLQELPLDTLKIDRAFVVALEHSDPTSSVANSIIQLASLFDLETVAEGVETPNQDQKIRSLGVDHIQGYLYSKPVAASDLPATIEQINQSMDWNSRNNLKRSA